MTNGHDLRMLLSGFMGSDTVWQHPLHKHLTYTEGFRTFLKNAGNGAFWLLDLLATQPEIQQGEKEHGFLLVQLDVIRNVGHLTVAVDTNREGGFEGVVYTQTIPYTDCPEGSWKFYYENGTLLLPDER